MHALYGNKTDEEYVLTVYFVIQRTFIYTLVHFKVYTTSIFTTNMPVNTEPSADL